MTPSTHYARVLLELLRSSGFCPLLVKRPDGAIDICGPGAAAPRFRIAADDLRLPAEEDGGEGLMTLDPRRPLPHSRLRLYLARFRAGVAPAPGE